MNIIGSKIVSKEFDIFWNENVSIDEAQKNTLVISTPYLPGSAEEQQLMKMLQACLLGEADRLILQIPQDSSVSWHVLRDKVKAENILLCGITPQQLGINAMMRFNEPNRFNGCVFIPTLALPELEQQAEAKKQLWLNALKPLFVDKTIKAI